MTSLLRFKEYENYKTKDYKSAKDYIKQLFVNEKKRVESSQEYKSMNVIRSFEFIYLNWILEINIGGRERAFFLHETCATDTDNIKKVFNDVKVTVFNNILTEIMV